MSTNWRKSYQIIRSSDSIAANIADDSAGRFNHKFLRSYKKSNHELKNSASN
ncbi:MAG: four helix bundle protein [Deltaproteobacteria bacterium]|nr:four helix bundle protein [Deltaproteobacteria bacterium]MBW2199970.1 four helix bundle protein [Deltaproteobacteria bacterium]MBW2539815.1 four helix bundle protein [Deltaproteobacteria bacterium]